MSNSRDKTSTKRPAGELQRLRSGSTRSRRGMIIGVAALVGFAVVVLYLIYQSSPGKQSGATAGSGYQHTVGQPRAGATAPAFTLGSGSGGQVSLADFRGKSVLVYFQEGLSCQPCWDQIRDLERNQSQLRAAGVDTVVSITTDPANLIGRKVTDEKLSTPVLSDPTMGVSRTYQANRYGMMGDMRDGHSFVLVGPDGVVKWRADYGGAPNYTMFLPTDKLLADLARERTP